MSDIDLRPTRQAFGRRRRARSAEGGRARDAESTTLSAEALAVTDKPTPPPISPIVLAGFVRMAEFALVMLVGLAIYAIYLGPESEAVRALFRRHLRHRRVVDAGVPDRRHLPGAGLPRLREAVHAAGLGVVGGLPRRHRRLVLLQDRRDVLARLARLVLCLRPVRAHRLAQGSVLRRAQMDARRPPHPPHGDRRRRRARRQGDRRTAQAEGFRRRDHRLLRRPQRRPRRRRMRRPAQARQRRRPGRVRPPHPRRPGDLLAADRGGRPHPADAEEAVGAAGRHPARRPHQQAAVPPAFLLLHRQGAGDRRVRPPDRRLGRGDEMAVR